MEKVLKIDIVSDVVCPWCIVGYKRLEKALDELGIKDQVEIEWQPFELNPNMAKEGQEIDAHLTEKYGGSTEEQKGKKDSISEIGNELGFKFNFSEGLKIFNTFDAHILLEYAHKFGKQTDLKLRLITAYFTENKDVSDRDVLKDALKEVGLNVTEGISLLDNETAKKELRIKQNYWKSLGVNSVPTIIFNQTSGVTGAQPVNTLKKILTDLLATQEA